MRNHDYLTRAQLRGLGFAAIGDDVRIHPTCVLVGCERMRIGGNVRIDPFCILTISGALTIGDDVHIAGHVTLAGAGPIEIGEHANVSHGARLLSSSDDFTGAGIAGPMVPAAYRQVTSAPVVVGRHAIVGAGAVLLPGAALGEGAALGALSLLKRHVPGWGVYAGTPARKVGDRDRAGVLAREERLRAERAVPHG